MKRKASIVAAALLIAVLIIPLPAWAASKAPTRVIHVVYDDSGSMYTTGGRTVDTWCQAKYSMEVFAAMLGERDSMNIYYMSDYSRGTSALPRIALRGSDGSAANVAKVHDQKTKSGNTPFNAVRKAYEDLTAAQGDEKWLVILTDGEFQGVNGTKGIDQFLSQKERDINVMFLGMGPSAGSITEIPDQGIFYIKAENTKQILNSVTNICTRIFNSSKLEVNTSTRRFSFDIPLGEIIVFVQGANVELNGIKKEGGSLIRGAAAPVEVKYSESDATDRSPDMYPPDKDLLGRIAFYSGDFEPGSYTVDVTGAETIEIYYKPNIAVAAYLLDKSGNVMDMYDLEAGDYTVNFGFVKAGTNEPVSNSKLLGNVSFQATASNAGLDSTRLYNSGDTLTLMEGPLIFDVTAYYLDYNSVSTELQFNVYKDKGITFLLKDDPEYSVLKNGFDKDDPILIEALIDGEPFTREQWDAMTVPSIELAKDGRDFSVELSELEKTDQPGIFQVRPVIPGGKPSDGVYRDVGFHLQFRQQTGSETWQGELDGTLKLTDGRYKTRTITFTVRDAGGLSVGAGGFEGAEPLLIDARIDDAPFTKEEWDALDLPTITPRQSDDAPELDLSNVEKSDEVGVLRLTPSFPKGKPKDGVYQDVEFDIELRQTVEHETWIGSGHRTLKVKDERSWLEQHWAAILRLAIITAILLILAGYLPIFKHYLPKNLKKKPYVLCVPKQPGVKRKERNGEVEKKLLSTIIPYVPQKGTIRYIPKGVTGCPIMSVKGIRERRMTITNIKAFAGKDYITLNGSAVPKDVKKFDTGAGITIQATRGDWTYTCNPNQSYKK